MATTPSMKITDTESDRRSLYLFDDENRAKVRRPIGTIDHDGWTYVTYGPLDDGVRIQYKTPMTRGHY